MAEAWVARLQGKFGFEKLVAIKTILPKYAADPRFQRMFLDEARIASRIEHTNVAQILDLGDEHDVLYLVMEWVDGDGLSKLHRAVEKKGARLPHGILLRIIADTCGGLHAAHELRGADGALLGVVHRDVSPQNILVSTRGVAKLIDFGVAKAKDRVAGDTNTGLLKGKILYMAPEQALGRPVDRRADIWAVGVLLHHLLSGQPPYEGANPLATLHLLTSGKPPPPLPRSVPKPIVEVVARALSHAPDDRPSSAAELQDALERAMVAAKVPTTTADVERFVALHLSDRATRRKQAIDLALRAASERIRIKPLIALPRADSIVDSDHPASRVSLDAIEPPPMAREPREPAREVPSTVPTQSERPPQPRPTLDSRRPPSAVARSRRAVLFGVGAVTCIIGMTAVISLRADSGGMVRRERLPPLAASIQSPIPTHDPDEGSAQPAPTPIASSASAGAVDNQPPASTTTPTAPSTAIGSWPIAPPAPKPSAPASKIPEVIDYGF
jgi:serine/threonine-protein kinase